MARKLKVLLDVDVNDREAVAELDRIQRKLKRTNPAARDAGRGMSAFATSTSAATTALKTMIPALGVAAIAGFGRQVVRASDDIERLRLAAQKVSGTSRGFDQLYASAQRLGIGLQDASLAANNFATPLNKLGVGFQGTLKFTEDLTNSLRLYGVQGQAAASVTTQLAQGLNSGQLAGDELRSLRENAGPLAGLFEEAVQQITNSNASLKELGSEGALTADVVYNAWQEVFSQLEGDFEQLPRTMEQQEAAMANAATRLFAALDGALEASEAYQWLTGGITQAIEAAALALEGLSFDRATAAAFGGLDTGLLTAEIQGVNDRLAELRSNAAAIQEDIAGYGDRGLLGSMLGPDLPELESELARITGEIAQQEGVRDAMVKKLQEQRQAEQAAAKAAQDQADALSDVAGAATSAGRAAADLVKNWNLVEHEKVNDSLRERFALMVQEEQITGRVTSAYRSNAKQAELRAKYLAGLGPLAAEAGKSLHNHGKALDFVAEGEKRLTQEMAARYGLQLRFYDDSAHVHIKMIDEQAEKTKKLATVQRNAATADRAAAAAAREAAAARRSAATEVEQLIRQYLPAEQAAREFSQAETALAVAGDAVGLSAEQQSRILRQLRADLFETGDAVDALGREMQTLEELTLEAARNTVDAIQNSLAGAFEDLFTGSLDSAADFVESLKDTLIRGIAQIAAQIATQQIVVPVVAAITGQGGSVGAGMQLFGSGGITGDPNTSVFGGGGFGGIGQMLTGNSIGAGVANTAARFGIGTGGGFFTNAGTNLIAASAQLLAQPCRSRGRCWLSAQQQVCSMGCSAATTKSLYSRAASTTANLPPMTTAARGSITPPSRSTRSWTG